MKKTNKKFYNVNGKWVSSTELDRLVKKDRAWHITLYDLQGGPLSPSLIKELDDFIVSKAKENNFAVERDLS